MTTPPRTPTCCELACYEDPGCTCDGCAPDPAPLDAPVYPTDLADEFDAGPPKSSYRDGYQDGYIDGHERRQPAVHPALSAPDPAPLDVERLARALHDYSGWYTDHTGPVCLACTEDAADIAREYAKEPQP